MKAMRRVRRFSPSVRAKCLAWCDRHCCFCGKKCGAAIVLHHLEPDLDSEMLNQIDNAMPLCPNCHADVERSRLNAPIGSKYHVDELKGKREETYELRTQHLVPPIAYGIADDPNVRYPNVRFFVSNPNPHLTARARSEVEILVAGRKYGTPVGHYSGKKLWTCNPGATILGWFSLAKGNHLAVSPKYRGPAPERTRKSEVRLRVHFSIIDRLKREHHRLPVEWYYARDRDVWVYDP